MRLPEAPHTAGQMDAGAIRSDDDDEMAQALAAMTGTSCAAAIAAHEASVKAFAWLDLDRAVRLTSGAPRGPLRGRWVGIKDVIDTAGIPTERGCRLYAGRVPERSAAVVERIEAAGGVVVGKTVTAELASAVPGPTCNPWNPSRTPGGSSMGSAAAWRLGWRPWRSALRPLAQ